jgi:hypothetical protein
MEKKTYLEKFLDPRWQQMRLRVFERDKWTCRCCKKTNNTLNAHHPVYRPDAEGPWDYDLDELVTLCAECHTNEHIGLEASKANVLLKLVKMGFWNSYELDALCDVLDSLTKDDLTKLFLEKLHGTNKNN